MTSVECLFGDDEYKNGTSNEDSIEKDSVERRVIRKEWLRIGLISHKK